jgi:hypothetical protein
MPYIKIKTYDPSGVRPLNLQSRKDPVEIIIAACLLHFIVNSKGRYRPLKEIEPRIWGNLDALRISWKKGGSDPPNRVERDLNRRRRMHLLVIVVVVERRTAEERLGVIVISLRERFWLLIRVNTVAVDAAAPPDRLRRVLVHRR